MIYVHILQFHSRKGGGVGSVVTDLCEEMARQQKSVYVISLFQNPNLDFEDEKKWGKEHNVTVSIMQKHTESKLAVFRNLRKAIKDLSEKENVTLFLHLKWGVLAGILSSLWTKNIRRIEVYHSGYMHYKLEAFFAKPFLHHYIAVSKEAKQQLVNWFRINPDKVTTVYNGVDQEEIQKILSDYSFDENRNCNIKYISVGRMTFEKGFLDPIAAFSSLKKEGKISNSTYTMIGEGTQKDEAERIADKNVEFTGMIPRNEVFIRIAQSDLVIMPSLWEGNSILLLESLTVGRALLVSDIPSFREVLGFKELDAGEEYRKEPFGFVFRKKDPESCKKAIEEAYNLSHDEVSNMGGFVKGLSPRFSIHKQASLYYEIARKSFEN